MLRRALLLAALCALAAKAPAQVAPPSENPTADADQGSKKAGLRPDAGAVKPKDSPVRVESDTVKLPDQQFQIPPDKAEMDAPPPDEPPAPPQKKTKQKNAP